MEQRKCAVLTGRGDESMKKKRKSEGQFWSYFILTIVALFAIIPFLVVISSSFSTEQRIVTEGYSLLPKGFSLEAYKYLFSNGEVILNAYLVTIFVTVVGVLVSLFLTSTTAYVISRDYLLGNKMFMFLVVFTMLFNGSLVPTYYIYTQVLHIKDTIFALIVPNLLLSAFNIIIMSNYFKNDISKSIIEAAVLDGAGEITIFFKLIIPLSTPILATVALMTAIGYWNDWQNALYYLSTPELNTIQQVLRLMDANMSYISNVGGGGIDRALPVTTIRMAIAVITAVPLIGVYPFFHKYFKKGITLGATKE